MLNGLGTPELILFTICIIPGTLGAYLAKQKGRNIVGWFFLSTVFWFSIFIVILLPPVREVIGEYRECPSCKEFIKWKAIVCKHCQTKIRSQT